MNTHVYRILTGAVLAVCVGMAGAQTYGNQPAATSGDKNAPQSMQAQPANPSGTAMAPSQNAPLNTQSSTMSERKATKSTHHAHATKARSHPQQTAMKGDKAYQDALRNCAKEQNQNARDKCLDSAIDQFHRNI